MSATAVAAIKAAILALTDESTRKKIGWVSQSLEYSLVLPCTTMHFLRLL